MTRVGFLALQAPDLSPGQRYRFEAFMPALARAGIEVDYAWVLDAADLRIFYGRAPLAQKARVALKAMTKRLFSLTRARTWDVVFVQREAFFLFNEWAEWLASHQAPVIFDFDDAIWIHSVSEANKRFAFLKNVDKIERIVALSHTVIAGNDYLATWARQHNQNVHVIPTCVDTDIFRPPEIPRPLNAGAPVTIGWSGSPSTVAHYRLFMPVFERLKRELGGTVRFRVMGDPTFSSPTLDVKGEAWSPKAEIQFLQEMDIGLMPLPDDEWSKGKCGLKGLTSMASGAATVMSDVGVNSQIVQHAVNGFLASNESQWVDAITSLVKDPALRARIGAAGRTRVIEQYSVQRWQSELVSLINAVHHNRR